MLNIKPTFPLLEQAIHLTIDDIAAPWLDIICTRLKWLSNNTTSNPDP